MSGKIGPVRRQTYRVPRDQHFASVKKMSGKILGKQTTAKIESISV